jgi:LmbE family N-acetylglucosaminyl deacetylase
MLGLNPCHRVLVVAPHPDDETLGCGGTIARLTSDGVAVHVLAIACPDLGQAGGNTSIRRNEFEAACNALGVSGRRILWIEDERALQPGAFLPDLVQAIEAGPDVSLRALRPDALMIPTGDGHHQDHQAVHRAGRAAARPGGADRHAPRILLGYDGPEDRAWNGIPRSWPVAVDTTDSWPIKMKALTCYPTQLREDPHPRSIERIEAFDIAAGAGFGSHTAERFLPYRMAF